jgi:hypothetical protein
MVDFLSSPFVAQINSLIRNDSSLGVRYNKVSGKIRDYAVSINLSPDDLPVMQIADDRAHLRKSFISFIKNLPPKPGATPERIKNYPGEICSDVKKLVTAVFLAATSLESEESRSGNFLSGSFLERQAPEWMSPLINILPRVSGNRCRRIPKGANRLTYPLTSNSIELLSVLLKVAETSNCSSLESLLVDCQFKILAETKLRYFGNRVDNLMGYLCTMRRQLGFKIGRSDLQSLPFEQWSPKIQKQWSKFEELTVSGVSKDSPLGKMATHYKMSLGKNKPVTVAGYKTVIGTGLFHCQPLPENWGIEDLLCLDVRTTNIAGLEYSEPYNHFIDRYQTREQDRVSNVKQKGFNSSTFERFTQALTVVATFNGLFNLVDPFRRAYKSNLDVESKRLNKDNKKKLFSISEIDENIARLEIEFNQIVKDGSFERRVGVSKIETNKKMRLCLFLPLLATMRFLGVRQRNVRNFRLMRDPENPKDPDGNFGFRKNGTLVIHYTEDETKNNKPIHLEFNLSDHDTHAPLIRILKIYYKKVYPYILRNAALSLERQLFAYMPDKFPGKFAFLPDTPKAFDKMFIGWSNEFLSFRNITAKNYRRLNAHHLRGICIDWLINVLHFSFERAAEYVADTIEMIRSEYIDRKRINDATFYVTESNRALRAADVEKEAAENARQLAEKERIEAIQRAEKDRADAALRDERHNLSMERMDSMNETIQSMERSRSAAEAKLAKLEAENKALAAENARLKNASKRKAGTGATAT